MFFETFSTPNLCLISPKMKVLGHRENKCGKMCMYVMVALFYADILIFRTKRCHR